MRLRRFAERVADWFRKDPRPLPWRDGYDPYRVLVSEFMLQQTQVETVIPYFHRFLVRFPSLTALAEASEDDVLLAWAGLGYYSRARNLHRAARRIREAHGGRVPEDPQSLVDLPGVGRYTAGAIASIAFNRPAGLVDGNVERVLARHFAIGDDIRTAAAKKRFWAIAERLVHFAEPRCVNQGLMELGAVICTPRNPRCAACPLKRSCAARKAQNPEDYPANPGRTPTTIAHEALVLVIRGGRVLLGQRRAGGTYAGMWDLPRIATGSRKRAALEQAFRSEHGLTLRIGARAGQATYGIMNARVTARFYTAELATGEQAAEETPSPLPSPGGRGRRDAGAVRGAVTISSTQRDSAAYRSTARGTAGRGTARSDVAHDLSGGSEAYACFRWIRFGEIARYALPSPVKRFLEDYLKRMGP